MIALRGSQPATRTPGFDLRAHAALWGVQVAFGLNPLFGKWAFRAFEPGAVAGWRIAFGAGFFLVVAGLVHGRRVVPSLGDLARLQLCALLGVAANQALYLEGLERSTAINTGLMMMLIPVFTFLIAIAVRQEPFSLRRGAGIVLALAGAGSIVVARGVDLRSEYVVGNLLLVGNTACYAAYLVASKPLMRRYPSLVVIAWSFALSAWCIPFVAGGSSWIPEDAKAEDWISLGLVILVPTLIAYLLNLYALGRVPASTAGVYVFAQPVVAALTGTFVLGEVLGAGTAAAAVCIAAGIWLVVFAPAREAP